MKHNDRTQPAAAGERNPARHLYKSAAVRPTLPRQGGLADIPQMTGQSGHLAGSVPAIRRVLQRWHRQDDAGSLADAGPIAV